VRDPHARDGIEGMCVRLIRLEPLASTLVQDPGSLFESVPGLVQTTLTNALGEFTFSKVAVGFYTVTAAGVGRESGSLGQVVVRDVGTLRLEPLVLRRTAADASMPGIRSCYDDVPELASVDQPVPSEESLASLRRPHLLIRATGTGCAFAVLGVADRPVRVAAALASLQQDVVVDLPSIGGAGVSVRLVPTDFVMSLPENVIASSCARVPVPRGSDAVQFRGVLAGEYVLALYDGDEMRGAAIVRLPNSTPGSVSSRIHPRWRRISVGVEGPSGPVSSGECSLRVVLRPAGEIDSIAGRPCTVLNALAGFVHHAHPVKPDCEFWIAPLEDGEFGFVARRGDEVGVCRATAESGESVIVRLERGSYITGRGPGGCGDVFVEIDRGWVEVATFGSAARFMLGPYPPSRLTLIPQFTCSRGGRRNFPSGVVVGSAEGGAPVQVDLHPETVSQRGGTALYCWLRDDVAMRLFRNGGGFPTTCPPQSGGFRCVQVSRDTKSVQVLLTPASGVGAMFGTEMDLHPGRVVERIHMPRLGFLSLSAAEIGTAERLAIRPTTGPDPLVFVRPWSGSVHPSSDLCLGPIPVGSYEVTLAGPNAFERKFIRDINEDQ
jgi:hypothetical protein